MYDFHFGTKQEIEKIKKSFLFLLSGFCQDGYTVYQTCWGNVPMEYILCAKKSDIRVIDENKVEQIVF